MGDKAKGPRCAVIVGPYTAGKTTLMEAMLFAAGTLQRKGTVPTGTTLGDASPEARARQMTTEPNVAHFSYLDDPWCLIDCPGSVELMQDARSVLMIADVAVVVVEPDASKAAMVAPLLRHLDEYAIPHILFFNKIDKAQVRVAELLSAYQAASPRPLVLRQVPIRQGDQIVGAVDLVSERAWHYNENKPSNLIQMPDSLKPREVEARQGLLETLADFDDKLMEQLLEEKTPASTEVYQQLAKDLQQDLIVPVFLGSAEHGNGIVRLLKALRHEAPSAAETAKRLGIDKGKGATLTVARTFYQAHTGKMSLARLWHGELKEGQALGGERPAGLFHLKGPEAIKITKAAAGDVVGLSRMEKLLAGQRLDEGGEASVEELWPQVPQPIYALALKPQNRADDVKLSGAIGKLIEEDPSLKLEHDQALHQMLLWGQGEIHLQVAVDRLKHKFNVAVETQKPITPYKETIRKSVEQHSRFKRQSGGHGQFADIKVQIRPLPRGAGFQFEDAVVGGAVPRQFIPSVEDGVRDSLGAGPLGFPVVDLAVKLHDGQFHSVDSSDMAFKTAGRQAMTEGLPLCEPVLLEPICEVTVYVPNDAMSRVNGLISSRRGQILGFEERPGWPGWDQIKCHLPQSEMSDLIVELRSLTQGAASFTWRFDHLQELIGRAADKVREQRQAAG